MYIQAKIPMTFDVWFLLLFGLFSLIMGVLNRGRAFWGSVMYDGLEQSGGKNYSRTINIVMGIISLTIALLLYTRG
jgi:hypothetical protein